MSVNTNKGDRVENGVKLVENFEQKGGAFALFSKHGLAGLVIGALFILHGYTLITLNGSLVELIGVIRELKAVVEHVGR